MHQQAAQGDLTRLTAREPPGVKAGSAQQTKIRGAFPLKDKLRGVMKNQQGALRGLGTRSGGFKMTGQDTGLTYFGIG